MVESSAMPRRISAPGATMDDAQRARLSTLAKKHSAGHDTSVLYKRRAGVLKGLRGLPQGPLPSSCKEEGRALVDAFKEQVPILRTARPELVALLRARLSEGSRAGGVAGSRAKMQLARLDAAETALGGIPHHLPAKELALPAEQTADFVSFLRGPPGPPETILAKNSCTKPHDVGLLARALPGALCPLGKGLGLGLGLGLKQDEHEVKYARSGATQGRFRGDSGAIAREALRGRARRRYEPICAAPCLAGGWGVELAPLAHGRRRSG
jgi:hypothetical protein